MLQSISIRNIALIDELEITFSFGFHVLTGETGAGKSIIIDAVNFVLGERANRDLIKSGQPRAFVQAVFLLPTLPALCEKLDEFGISYEDNELILSRELTASGKNTCRINSVLVNLSSLRAVTSYLVDVHGQHDHQSLLQADDHIGYLDAFSKNSISPLVQTVSQLFSEHAATQKMLLSGFTSNEDRLRKLDMLAYQINEIETANLFADEEERLTSELQRLSNAMEIISSLEHAYSALHDEGNGGLVQTYTAVRNMEVISPYHADYETLHQRLQDAYYTLEDASYTLRDLKNTFEFDPVRLQEIELRLNLIHGLERKYGKNIPDILLFLQNAHAEQTLFLESDERRAALTQKCDLLAHRYQEAARALTKERIATGKRLSAALVEQLRDLGMKNAKFEVLVEATDHFSPHGMDKVEFLISTNTGEPVKPLHKVASGGELSRIMLGFKTINMGVIPTIVFDEIDTGISGDTAVTVGKKIAQIAAQHQVLCITHLAQIAAMADVHFLVEKTENQTHAVSSIRELDETERVEELAHMMSGSVDDESAREHARSLLYHLYTKK